MLVEKRLGQRQPGLTDDLYQTWREVGRRGLKETPEYRDVLLRADRHALWLAGFGRLPAAGSPTPENRTRGHVGCRKKNRLVKPVSAHPRNYKYSLINRYPSLRSVAATYSSSRFPLV